MIATSKEWKTYSAEHGVFHIKAVIDNGTQMTLTDEDFMQGSVSITDSVSGMDKFNVGSVITNSFSATLNNFTGKFNYYQLAGAVISVQFGIVYEDESEEWIDRGVYTIEKPTSLGSTIQITGYDNMDRLNRYYTGGFDIITNLLDPTKVEQNKALSQNGAIVDRDGYYVTDYIAVTNNSNYTCNLTGDSIYAYDSGKNYIGRIYLASNGEFTATVLGQTVSYIRGMGVSALLTQAYVKGTPNLFNSQTITANSRLLRDGTIQSPAPSFVTDYIGVRDSTTYRTNLSVGYVVCYDSSRNYLGSVNMKGGDSSNWTFTTYIEGETVAYVRGCSNNSDLPRTFVQEQYGAFIFPYRASRMVEYLCKTYNVGWDASSWQLDDFTVDEFTYNESTTCRQVVSWIMQIAGGYARINPTGVIECKTFNKHEWTISEDLDGGVINPWETVDSPDGGTVDPWSAVTDYDGGSSGGAEFSLSKIKSMNVYIEDITITGVRAYVYNTIDDSQYGTSGSDGYVIGIDNNPLISASNCDEVAERVGDALIGLRFRPFDATIFGDPCIEAGDVVALQDYLGETHVSLITSLSYSLNNAEQIECDAETTVQNVNGVASSSTSVVQDAYHYVIDKMDGHVVEQGSSNGWTYRIWSNGVKECWYRTAVASASFSAWGNGYATAEYTVPDYPFTFSSYPVVQMTAQVANGAGWALPNHSNYSENNCGSYYVASLSSGSKNFTINIYAKGV